MDFLGVAGPLHIDAAFGEEDGARCLGCPWVAKTLTGCGHRCEGCQRI